MKQSFVFFARNLQAVENGAGKSASEVLAALEELRHSVRPPFLEPGRTLAIRWKKYWQRRYLARRPLLLVNGLGSVTLLEKTNRFDALPRSAIIVRESPRHYELLGEDPNAKVRILNTFRHRIFVSSIARDRWLALGVSSENAHYLPNTLRRDSPSSVDGKDSDLARFDGERLNVLVVGSLQKRKGQDLVIEAVLAHPELGTRYRFFFIGDDKKGTGPSLRTRAEGSEAVVFLGKKNHLREYYEKADLVLQPSRAEAMSRVMLEALKCGAPFVGTEIEGSSEVIRHSIDGRLFAPDDVDALTRELLWLAQNPNELRALGERGRARFNAEYEWSRYLDRWRALIPRLRD